MDLRYDEFRRQFKEREERESRFANPGNDNRTRTRGGIVAEVWDGDRSLAETYLLWNVLVGNIGIGFIGGYLVSALNAPFLAFLYFALIAIPYTIWIVIGSWRSATKNPGAFAIAVKLLIVFGLFKLTTDLLGIGVF